MALLGNVTAHLAVRNNTAVLQPHLYKKKKMIVCAADELV